MIDFLPLIKDSKAYKTVKADLNAGRLSHAYLILCKDKSNIDKILRIFAKLILCEKEDPCGECRTCKLIDQGSFPDVYEYPEKGDVILKDDVVSLIKESFLKPVEGDKKIFLLKNAEDMNAVSQNKLLKTLEEPPQNVHIFLGGASEYALLPTVKSRVKILTIPEFSQELLFSALSPNFNDTEKLSVAISCGDGTVGKAETLYGDEKFLKTVDFACDMMVNMQSSRSIPAYSQKFTALKIDFSEFITVLELALRDLLCFILDKKELAKGGLLPKISSAKGFNQGAILYLLGEITETRKRLSANVNSQMLTDRFLFAFLEGKHKWSK